MGITYFRCWQVQDFKESFRSDFGILKQPVDGDEAAGGAGKETDDGVEREEFAGGDFALQYEGSAKPQEEQRKVASNTFGGNA